MVQLFERAPAPLLPGVQGPLDLCVRYLRRKPGRGLTVLYKARALSVSRASGRSSPDRWGSLTLGEAALAGTQIRLTASQAQQAALGVQLAGIPMVPDQR